MIGLKSIYEPVEVYMAAVGDTEPLAQRIESGVEMMSWERETLACFLRGELALPRRGKGEKSIPHLKNTEAHHRQRDLENATLHFHEMMRRLEEAGTKYGRRDDVLKYVAELHRVNLETLENRIRRSKVVKSKTHEPPKMAIVLFHEWLHRTGRLPDYEPRISAVGWHILKEQKGPRRR